MKKRIIAVCALILAFLLLAVFLKGTGRITRQVENVLKNTNTDSLPDSGDVNFPEPEPEEEPEPEPEPDDGRIYLCERLEVPVDAQGSVSEPKIDGDVTYYCTVHLVVEGVELEYNLGSNTPFWEEGLGEYSITFGGGDEVVYVSYYDSSGWDQWNPDGVPAFISVYYYAS